MTHLNYRSAPVPPKRPAAKGRGTDEANVWLMPTILLGLAFAIYITDGFIAGGAEGAATVGLASLVVGIVQTALLVGAAFLTASLFGIGFGELWVGILRLAAAGMFSAAAGALVPIPFAGTIIFLILMVTLFGLEFHEALVFTVVYFIVSLLVVIAIAAVIVSMFGAF